MKETVYSETNQSFCDYVFVILIEHILCFCTAKTSVAVKMPGASTLTSHMSFSLPVIYL